MYWFYKKVNVVYCKNMNWDKWVTGEIENEENNCAPIFKASEQYANIYDILFRH